jgi:hypothetical protein
MKTRRAVLALVSMLLALAVAASTAGAVPIPPRYHPAKPAPVPAGVVVVKTAATLGASYRWVQPLWVMRNGVTLPRIPVTAGSVSAQPPSWVPIG